MRPIRRFAAAAAIVGAGALPVFAQKSAPPPKVQQYHVTFAFPSDPPYTGSMTLSIRQGKVAGKMAIETPQAVTGTVAGTVKGDTLSLDYPYDVGGDKPCTGRVTVTARFNASRTEARGTTHSEGCGNPQDGEFTLTKAAK